MATITTDRTVNVGQLSAEMGNSALSVTSSGQGSEIVCHETGVTTAALQAAVDAHVAVDELANETTLQQRAETALADNRTFLALAAPTNTQTLAQVKALTRQNNSLIRLALGKLDATD